MKPKPPVELAGLRVLMQTSESRRLLCRVSNLRGVRSYHFEYRFLSLASHCHEFYGSVWKSLALPLTAFVIDRLLKEECRVSVEKLVVICAHGAGFGA